MSSPLLSRGLAAVLLFTIFGFMGCSGTPERVPAAPPVTEPDGPLRAIRPDPFWWKGFSDPLLDVLVETALHENLRLKTAFARLETARAAAAQAGSRLFPGITGEGGAGRSRAISPAGDGDAVYSNRYTIGVAAAYEVDLWGRLAALREGAELDALAAQSDVAAMRVTITAEVAEAWFSLEAERARLKLLREQIQTNETYLKLTKLRFGQGLAGAADIYQQRVQLSGTKAQLPLTLARIARLSHRLNLLMGRAPQSPIPEISEITDPPAPPTGDLPTTLLQLRPDIEAARLRVAAADQRAAAALADRFPALRLSLSTGFRASEIAQLFESWIWDLAAALSGTIYDGGGEAAAVRRARSVVQERIWEYAGTALRAYGEVEDGLAQIAGAQEYLEALNQQIGLAENSLRETRSRYVNGLSDYLPVLTTLQTLQRLELERIDARRSLLSDRITLCRALGGYWI